MDVANEPHRVRVVLSAYAISPVRGSEAGQSWSIAERLASRGHTVTVVTTSRYLNEHALKEHPPSFEIVYVDVKLPKIAENSIVAMYLRYIMWLQRSARTMRPRIIDGEFDVTHHYSWGTFVFGSPLARQSTPSVFGPVGGATLSPRDLMPLYRTKDRWFERARAIGVRLTWLNPLARGAIRASDVILAANSDARSALERVNAGRATLTLKMPESIDERWLSAPLPARTQRQRTQVLWVGRAMPRKGLPLAVRAMEHLPNRYELIVFGDGPDLRAAVDLTRTLGLSRRVQFRGAVPWLDLVQAYDQSGVLLFTSIRDTTGVQLLEAGSRGLPIVAINHQGVRDYVPRAAGRLVEVVEADALPAALAGAILELTQDDERYEVACRTARAFAESHSLASSAAEIEAAYRSAIERHTHHLSADAM